MTLDFTSSLSMPSSGNVMPMTRARIEELGEHLPSEWFMGAVPMNTPTARRRQAAEKRRARLRFDPAFGWKFAELYAQHDAPLPWVAMDEPLIEAHRFLTSGEVSPMFARVLALGGHPLIGAALRALLVAKNADVDAIAGWLGEDRVVVEWFAVLLWNPAHRRDEPGYITAVVYPRSRLEMLDTEAAPSWELSLLRLGWTGGMAAVFEALGTNQPEGTTPSLDQIEELLIRDGLELARLGGFQRRNVPALREATRLLHTKKLSDAHKPPSQFPPGGLEQICQRYSVADEIMAHAAVAAAPVLEDPRDPAIRAKLLSARRDPAADGKSDNSGKHTTP